MTNNKTEGVKPVKERDTLDLLNLVCELHARALVYGTKELHDASVEARKELESRLSPSPPPPPGVEQRAKEIVDLFQRFMPKEIAVDDPKQVAMYQAYHKFKEWSTQSIAGSESQGREAHSQNSECPMCGGSGVFEPALCDVEGCKNEVSSQGCSWRETGYWCICYKHSAAARFGEPQPKMKQSAIEREASRDADGILPPTSPK